MNVKSSTEGKVLRMLEALHGLIQSTNVWNKMFHTFMMGAAF